MFGLVGISLGQRQRWHKIKEIEVKRRNKWLLFGGIVFAVAASAAILGYDVVRIILDIKSMESRRPVLLYQTDHQALLEACRELAKRVNSGEIKFDKRTYVRQLGDFDLEKGLFPKPIVDLAPFQVHIEKNGVVHITMSPLVRYGVRAYPVGVGSACYGDFELIPGLWYFDQHFVSHPEHKKEIEKLLKKKMEETRPSRPSLSLSGVYLGTPSILFGTRIAR